TLEFEPIGRKAFLYHVPHRRHARIVAKCHDRTPGLAGHEVTVRNLSAETAQLDPDIAGSAGDPDEVKAIVSGHAAGTRAIVDFPDSQAVPMACHRPISCHLP